MDSVVGVFLTQNVSDYLSRFVQVFSNLSRTVFSILHMNIKKFQNNILHISSFAALLLCLFVPSFLRYV